MLPSRTATPLDQTNLLATSSLYPHPPSRFTTCIEQLGACLKTTIARIVYYINSAIQAIKDAFNPPSPPTRSPSPEHASTPPPPRSESPILTAATRILSTAPLISTDLFTEEQTTPIQAPITSIPDLDPPSPPPRSPSPPPPSMPPLDPTSMPSIDPTIIQRPLITTFIQRAPIEFHFTDLSLPQMESVVRITQLLSDAATATVPTGLTSFLRSTPTALLHLQQLDTTLQEAEVPTLLHFLSSIYARPEQYNHFLTIYNDPDKQPLLFAGLKKCLEGLDATGRLMENLALFEDEIAYQEPRALAPLVQDKNWKEFMSYFNSRLNQQIEQLTTRRFNLENMV